MSIVHSGVPMVVSAPSGAGKTTLCRGLMKVLSGVEYSISHTTRPLRGQEQDGVDYHFIDHDAFSQLIEQDAFLEWATVHENKYGTSRADVERRLADGIDILFDIDVQGGEQLIERMPDAVLVFVLPPDMATLEQRLRNRQTDSEHQIQRRLAVAKAEIQSATFYPYWIVNDDVETATQQLLAVLTAERLRRRRKEAVLEAFGGE